MRDITQEEIYYIPNPALGSGSTAKLSENKFKNRNRDSAIPAESLFFYYRFPAVYVTSLSHQESEEFCASEKKVCEAAVKETSIIVVVILFG